MKKASNQVSTIAIETNNPNTATYTHQDWLDGKIFYYNNKLCLDLKPKAGRLDISNMINCAPDFIELTAQLSRQELEKIKVDQLKFYQSRVAYRLVSYQISFRKSCQLFSKKLDMVKSEIEFIENILNPKVQTDTNQFATYNFGVITLSASALLCVPSILKDVSLKNKPDTGSINSDKCRFSYISCSQLYLEVDSYFQYLVWLQNINNEWSRRNEIKANENVLTLFNFFEAITSTTDKLSMLSDYFKNILIIDDEIDILENGFEMGFRHDKYYQLYPYIFFKKHFEQIKFLLRATTLKFDNDEKVKVYINQVYDYTISLREKNKQMLKSFSSIEEQKLTRGILDCSFSTFIDELEIDYESYLKNTAKLNITIQSFLHRYLHHFHSCNKKMYDKEHNPGCECLQSCLNEIQEYNKIEFPNFEKQYHTIVSNWLKYNKDLGHTYYEHDFIVFANCYLKELFQHDKSNNTYFVPDLKCGPFVFHHQFYQEHIIPLINFLNTFFAVRSKAIDNHKHFSVPTSDKTQKRKVKIIPHSFTIATKYKEHLIDVFNQLVLQQMVCFNFTCTIEQFKHLFSGNPLVEKLRWEGYAEELHYFIQKMYATNIITNKKNTKWQITSRCFIDKKGDDFTADALLKTLNPSDNTAIKKSICAFGIQSNDLRL